MPELNEYILEGGTSENTECVIKIRCNVDGITITNMDDVIEESVDDEVTLWVKNYGHESNVNWGFVYYEESIQKKSYKSKEEAICLGLKFAKAHLTTKKQKLIDYLAKIEILLAKLD